MENKFFSSTIITMAIIVMIIVIIGLVYRRGKQLEEVLMKAKYCHRVKQDIKMELVAESDKRYKIVLAGLVSLWLLCNLITYYSVIDHNGAYYGIKSLFTDNCSILRNLFVIPFFRLKWLRLAIRKYTFRGFEHLETEIQEKVREIATLELRITDLKS